MIQSHADYKAYLDADRVSLGKNHTWRDRVLDEIWLFQRRLRRVEYLTNCRKSRLRRLVAVYQYRQLGIRLGFSIPINVFGPGLALLHYGTIVINAQTRVGANCRVHAGVNIGAQLGPGGGVPRIGDNCYLGPGAKLFGAIVIGDNTVIGANAVVNKSFPNGNVTLGGVPARIISEKSTAGLFVLGYKKAQ
jgi:serine O-acetyltransferase